MKETSLKITKEIAKRSVYVLIGGIDILVYAIGGNKLKKIWINKLSQLNDKLEDKA